MSKKRTREEWLERAMSAMKPWFEKEGHPLPKNIKVSVGFVKGRGDKGIGQCFDPKNTKDQSTHIFICPTQAEPVRVLDILLHELIHAAVGIKEGHKGKFKELAQSFGLAGKMTATYAEEGSDLHKRLCLLFERLGEYPHSQLLPSKKVKGKGNGWVRYKSTQEENYKIVIAGKVVEEFGAPVDPWGEEMVPNEGD